jgi:hypothetical protein
MSQREIIAIAIKVFSLWFLCWLFIQVSSFIPMLATLGSWQGREVPNWVYIAICFSFLLAGLIIAALLFSVSTKALDSMSIETDIVISEENRKYILQVSGLFFVVSSLTWLPSSFIFLFYENHETSVLGLLLKPAGNLIQLIVGLWLIVHPSWWALVFKKLRGRV